MFKNNIILGYVFLLAVVTFILNGLNWRYIDYQVDVKQGNFKDLSYSLVHY